MGTIGTTYSGFLSLPTELRCHIYDYLLADSHAVTISAGYITCFGNRIQDRARKTHIPGLPLDLTPMARCYHDTSLLSVMKPPTIAVEDGQMNVIASKNPGIPAPLALLSTCRLVNDELTDYTRRRRRIAQAHSASAGGGIQDTGESSEGLSLYVSYPYGVLVLKSLYPFLLKQARRVYISGYQASPQESEPTTPPSLTRDGEEGEVLTPTNSPAATSFTTPTSGPNPGRSFSSTSRCTARTGASVNASRPRLRLEPLPPREADYASRTTVFFSPFSRSTSTLASVTLSHLIRTVLPNETNHLAELTARILYPGENAYGAVWSEDHSPIIHILRNIAGGDIKMKVKRGALGTGMRLEATPKPDGRVVSTSWETWKSRDSVSRIGGREVRRAGGRVTVADLDRFLMGEDLATA